MRRLHGAAVGDVDSYGISGWLLVCARRIESKKVTRGAGINDADSGGRGNNRDRGRKI